MPSSSSRPASSASQRTPTPKSSAFAPRASATARKPTQYGRTTWSLSDPRSALWRGKMYIDGQFSWGMLEWWEQVLVGTVVLSLTFLFWYSLVFHFPQHARGAARRASYYIWGASNLGGASAADGAVLSQAQLAAEKARDVVGEIGRVEL